MDRLEKIKHAVVRNLCQWAPGKAWKAALSGEQATQEARLWSAMEAGDAEATRDALALGACPARCSAQGITPLHHAARAGNLPVLQVLIQALAPPQSLDEPSAGGHTALSDAAAAGHAACVQALLAAGANPNATGPRGTTVLHRAASQDNAHLLRTLHEAGADWQARDVDGATPLDVMARHRPRAAATWARAAGQRVGQRVQVENPPQDD